MSCMFPWNAISKISKINVCFFVILFLKWMNCFVCDVVFNCISSMNNDSSQDCYKTYFKPISVLLFFNNLDPHVMAY
jgi:uncharacterized protein YegL